MSFNWFDLIVAFGILQGVVSSGLLLRKGTVSTASKFLIALLLISSMLSFKILLHTLKLWDTNSFRYFPLAIDLVIQPLIYLYVRSLTSRIFFWRDKTWLNFVPAALFMTHALMVYFLVLPEISFAQKDALAEVWHFNQVKQLEDYLSVVSGFVYGYFSLVSVQRYRRWLKDNVSDTNYATFNWLKHVLLLTGLLGLVLFINVFTDHAFYVRSSFLRWQIFYVYLSVLTCYLAYKGLQGQSLPQPVAVNHENQSSDVLRFTMEELEAAKRTILAALREDRVFLDNELTLQKLAQQLQLSVALTSTVINKDLNQSFRTLINTYRVDEVKTKLKDPRYSHLSILGIALESGFNSEASFYRIFKTATGHSPKRYLKL